mmetsp:Transcript_4908/g.10906  ORF Transcript_4908/g.10906 Transcript_4908/m.10906 type:complete len:210 (+) Transcript_4908:135-764(+)
MVTMGAATSKASTSTPPTTRTSAMTTTTSSTNTAAEPPSWDRAPFPNRRHRTAIAISVGTSDSTTNDGVPSASAAMSAKRLRREVPWAPCRWRCPRYLPPMREGWTAAPRGSGRNTPPFRSGTMAMRNDRRREEEEEEYETGRGTDAVDRWLRKWSGTDWNPLLVLPPPPPPQERPTTARPTEFEKAVWPSWETPFWARRPIAGGEAAV